MTTNLFFLIDIALVTGVLYLAYKIIDFRLHSEQILRKYKKGTPEYDAYASGLSSWWIVLVTFAFLVTTIKMVLDIRTLQHENGDAAFGHIMFLALVGLAICTPIAISAHIATKRK